MDTTKITRYQQAYSGVASKRIKTYMGQTGYN
jgi:hypothetical protein